MSDDLKIARLCLPVRIRSTPHTRRNGCAWGASPRTGPLFRSTADLCGVEPGGRYLETLTMRGLQYGGRRMPWYPHTHACDACPNPSRGLVQACLWGRVRRVVREPALESAYLSRVYGPLFSGLP